MTEEQRKSTKEQIRKLNEMLKRTKMLINILENMLEDDEDDKENVQE